MIKNTNDGVLVFSLITSIPLISLISSNFSLGMHPHWGENNG